MRRLLIATLLLTPLALQAASEYPAATGWDYKGVIRTPTGGGNYEDALMTLTYYEECGSFTDPSDGDGYPGCLCGSSNVNQDLWGCFDIKPPAIPASKNAAGWLALSAPSQVVAWFNPADGDIHTSECTGEGTPFDCCTAGTGQGDCELIDRFKSEQFTARADCLGNMNPYVCCDQYQKGPCNYTWRDMFGLTFYDPANDLYVINCQHDWYNTGHGAYDSLCWGDAGDVTAAEGAWGLKNENAPEVFVDVCTAENAPFDCCTDTDLGTCNTDKDYTSKDSTHADRVSWYTGLIPQAWANTNLSAGGSPYCFAGMLRASGDASSGPSMYAFPCSKPAGGGEEARFGPYIAATPLIAYGKLTPKRAYPVAAAYYDKDDFSAAGPLTRCRDMVWAPEAGVIAVSCTYGGPVWWYGSQYPWEACNAHREETGVGRKFHVSQRKLAGLDVTLDSSGTTTIDIDGNVADLCTAGDAYIPPGPNKGTPAIDIKRDTGSWKTDIDYNSFSADVFTIPSTDFTSNVATAGYETEESTCTDIDTPLGCCTGGVGECTEENVPYDCCTGVDQGDGTGECRGVGACNARLECCITDQGAAQDDANAWKWQRLGADIPAGYYSRCDTGKGYQGGVATGPPWRDQEIYFYDQDDLADVANGIVSANEIEPVSSIYNHSGMWSTCSFVLGIAFDGLNLYQVERWSDGSYPVIHVWEYTGEIEPPEPTTETLEGSGMDGGGIGK
jgi:hypothetical protein